MAIQVWSLLFPDIICSTSDHLGISAKVCVTEAREAQINIIFSIKGGAKEVYQLKGGAK